MSESFADIFADVRSSLAKMRRCHGFLSEVDAEIARIVSSDDFISKCRSLVFSDFADEENLLSTRDVIRRFEPLFYCLYRRQVFASSEFGSIYSAWYRRLSDLVNSSSVLFDSAFLASAPRFVLDAVRGRMNSVHRFFDGGYSDSVNRLYAFLYVESSVSIDTLVTSYLGNSSAWVSLIQQSVVSDDSAVSNYVSNSKGLATCFERICGIEVDDDYFDMQTESFRKHLKEYVARETLVSAVPDVLSELGDTSVDVLREILPRVRIGLLSDNGFGTLRDIYSAPVQSIYAIRGVSEDNAYSLKYEVKKYADELCKETKTCALRLDYDDRNDNCDIIVRDIYVCRRILSLKKKFHEFGELDFSKISNAIRLLFGFTSDVQWLFFNEIRRHNIIRAYVYLKRLFDDERRVNYEGLLKYRFDRVSDVAFDVAWDDFRDDSIAYHNCIEFLIPGAFEDGSFGYGLPEALAREIEEEVIYPDGLVCELRRYQQWGVKYALHQKRALLGDEMGLGKTVQAIGTMVSLRNGGCSFFIVICPASVLYNWFREIQRHSRLHAYVGHGSYKSRREAVHAWRCFGGVLVTTYDTYSTLEITDVENVGLVVVDEAHYVKNPNARRSKVVRSLCAKVERVLFLTGTPLENHVDEMLSLISVLDKDIARSARPYAHALASNRFRNAIAPVYFRRKQEEVNQELPKRIDIVDWCEMSLAEYSTYDNAVLGSGNPFMPMRKVSWNVDDLKYSSKAAMLKEIAENAISESRKVIVFSFFKDVLSRACDFLGDICASPINGSTSPFTRQEIIDDFSRRSDLWVLPCQIQSGGTGLNIQAASVVVICEPQIKPSIESQAVARVHRMGQSRTVIVHRLCCKDSIDEKILNLLESKQRAFDLFADKSVSGEKILNEDDGADLDSAIAEEIEKIRERNNIVETVGAVDEDIQAWYDEYESRKQFEYGRIENRGRKRCVSRAQRYRILMRDNFTCQKCGRYSFGACDDNGERLPEPSGGYCMVEVDHKVPFSLGGSDSDDNLWVLCSDCNSGKSNKYVD